MPRPFFDFVMHHVGADDPVHPSPPQREAPLYEGGVIANGDRGEFVKRFSLSHLR